MSFNGKNHHVSIVILGLATLIPFCNAVDLIVFGDSLSGGPLRNDVTVIDQNTRNPDINS
jgi:hypothetical protein